VADHVACRAAEDDLGRAAVLVGAHHDGLGIACTCHVDDRVGDRDVQVIRNREALGLEPASRASPAPFWASRCARSRIDSSISRAVRMSISAGGSPIVAVGSSSSSKPTLCFQTTTTTAGRPPINSPASRTACSAAGDPSYPNTMGPDRIRQGL
jgi:hypothetical protein